MPPLTRGLTTGAIAVALLLGAGACGGGDGEKKAASKPTSPASSATSFPTDPLESLDPADPVGRPTGLPSDFPTTEVPLVGKSFKQPLGAGSGEEGKKGWVLEVKLTQTPAACFDQAAAALTEHGYVEQPGERNNQGIHEAYFIGDGYAVIISVSAGDNGGCRLGYEVGQVHP